MGLEIGFGVGMGNGIEQMLPHTVTIGTCVTFLLCTVCTVCTVYTEYIVCTVCTVCTFYVVLNRE